MEIGAGAKILGNIEIGANARIAAARPVAEQLSDLTYQSFDYSI